MNERIEQAAMTLHESLSHFPWFIAVGGVDGTDERLVVLVTDECPNTSRFIPEQWEGYPVTHKRTTAPMPL